MAIIRNITKENSQIKAKVNPTLLKQIEEYCQWAGIYDLGYFVDKAAASLFQHDIEWNSHKKQLDATVD